MQPMQGEARSHMDKDTIRDLEQIKAAVSRIEARIGAEELTTWEMPVGTSEYPPAMWYCAQYHTYPSGANRHTGIDLNLDLAPWGDVDRHQPIYAIADGVVHEIGYSAGWLGVVVIRHEHEGQPLWARYAHLEKSVAVEVGEHVLPGRYIGRIGNYVSGRGGDHLHFDMALDPFGWAYYRTSWVRWIDPVPVLKAHLPEDEVDAMLRKGDQ